MDEDIEVGEGLVNAPDDPDTDTSDDEGEDEGDAD